MIAKISQQKALGIVRREQGRHWWQQTWDLLMQGESILLSSGAKLWYRKKSSIQATGFYIGGYHYADEDVKCYL